MPPSAKMQCGHVSGGIPGRPQCNAGAMHWCKYKSAAKRLKRGNVPGRQPQAELDGGAEGVHCCKWKPAAKRLERGDVAGRQAQAALDGGAEAVRGGQRVLQRGRHVLRGVRVAHARAVQVVVQQVVRPAGFLGF